MQSVVFAALNGDTGTDDFRESVNIKSLDTSFFFNALSHTGSPGFRTENACADRQITQINTLFASLFNQVQEVTGRTADGGYAEVTDEHDLTFAVAAAGGNDSCAEGFSAVVGAETAGKESVTVRNLDDIFFRESAAGQGTFHHFCPDIKILLRISYDDRFSGRAAGGVETDDFTLRYSKKTERISVAQIGFHRKGESGQVVQTPDAIAGETPLVHSGTEQPDVIIRMRHDRLKAGKLEFTQIILIQII